MATKKTRGRLGSWQTKRLLAFADYEIRMQALRDVLREDHANNPVQGAVRHDLLHEGTVPEDAERSSRSIGSRTSQKADIAVRRTVREVLRNAARTGMPLSEEDREIEVQYDALQLRLDDLIAGKEQFTDLTNAELFVKAYQDRIRYCMAWKKWLIWDDHAWRPDDCGEIFALCKDFLRGLYLQVATVSDHKRAVDMASHVVKSESLRRRQALVESASYERKIRITPKDVDQEPFLLNVLNGTIDLKTGELMPSMKNKYITKCAMVTYDRLATCPTWISFLLRIMNGNVRLIAFCRRPSDGALPGT